MTALAERSVAGLHAALLHRLPPPAAVRSVLDVGCGSGAWLARLQAAGYHGLLGVDQDIAQFGAPGLACLAADLDEDALPVQPGSVDLMTAIELIEHLHNPGRLFVHAARALSPQGRLLLTTPNVESVLARLRFLLSGKLKQFDDKGDPTHVAPVFRACLVRVAARHGLHIVDRWGYPEDGSSPTSRPALRAAARVAALVLPRSTEGDVACYWLARDPG